MRRLCKEAKEQGFTHMKMKVGRDIKDDMRRANIIREEIGYDLNLMMDANQKWDVDEAIENMNILKKYKPWFIEEPTSPDDILGHAKIRKAIAPIEVATGEHCQNRVMFKQMMQAKSFGICQIDSCRVGGVNELLAIYLMAAKFNVPVCPHAGGVGLCEYVQHLQMIDYICISGTYEGRIVEYVDHLHDHFYDPVVIKNGAYMPPKLPGYSIQMKEQSLIDYCFPTGKIWRDEAKQAAATNNWRKSRDHFISEWTKLASSSHDIIKHTDSSYQDLAQGIFESISSGGYPELIAPKNASQNQRTGLNVASLEAYEAESPVRVAEEEPAAEEEQQPDVGHQDSQPPADTQAAVEEEKVSSPVREERETRGNTAERGHRAERGDRPERGDRRGGRGDRGRGERRGRGEYRGRGERGGRGRGNYVKRPYGEDAEGFTVVKEDNEPNYRGRGRGRGGRGRGRGDRGGERGADRGRGERPQRKGQEFAEGK